MKVSLLFFCIFVVKASYADSEIHLGAFLSYGYIPGDPSPLSKGSYSFTGGYLAIGRNEITIAKMKNNEECNKRIINGSFRRKMQNNWLFGISRDE